MSIQNVRLGGRASSLGKNIDTFVQNYLQIPVEKIWQPSDVYLIYKTRILEEASA